MRPAIIVIGAALLAFANSPSLADTWLERDDWAQFFPKAGADGTIVVVDEREKDAKKWVHGETRATTRYLPASTFKVPHTLFALDAGVIRDEFQVFRWDGTKRGIEVWDHDQNLRSAMRNSVGELTQ